MINDIERSVCHSINPTVDFRRGDTAVILIIVRFLSSLTSLGSVNISIDYNGSTLSFPPGLSMFQSAAMATSQPSTSTAELPRKAPVSSVSQARRDRWRRK